MATQEHLDLLLQGVGTWNHWRQQNPAVKPDLSGANLRDACLIRVNLSNANLNHTRLRGTDLSGATLINAGLVGAVLSCTNLSDANLSGANLSGARLIRADLSGANLSGANLSGANLSGATLAKADLSGANLSGANLSGAELNDAGLRDANLTNAKFSDPSLRGTVLTDTEVNKDFRYIYFVGHGYSAGKSPTSKKNEPLSWLKPTAFSVLRDLKLSKRNSSIESSSDEKIFIEKLVRRLASSTMHGQVLTTLSGSSTSKRTLIKEKDFCQVHAEMDAYVVVHHVTTLNVTLSNELFDAFNSAASQSGKAEINSDTRLIVQVIPKINFTNLEGDRKEVDPPEKRNPHQILFHLRATHLGEGEVWVVLRQEQITLLTLVLRPVIVENRAVRRAMVAQSTASPSNTPQSSDERLQASGSLYNFSESSEPLHQLRIIERRSGSEITYLYELNSPRLGILSLHESNPLTSNRYEYVENLYKEIESRWLSTQGDVEDFAAELRAFGGQLFDQLFPEQLQQQLWNYREQLDSIMIISTEPFIPWELVHLKSRGQNRLPSETWFLGQMGLVRWLHDVGFPPKEINLRFSVNTHYIIPHYPDSRYRLPQAEQETQFLEQIFGATKIDPQPTPVRQLLEAGNFDLLHFAGHGIAEQGNISNAKLMLEGQMKNVKYVPSYLSATTVEQYCNCNGRDRNDRPMVVLNACQIGREGYGLTGISGFAQAFLKGGVGIFIGTLWSVGDRPARIFTETLYSSLIEGMTLAEATSAARQQAKQTGDAAWLAYVVYGHPHLQLRIVNDQID